MARMITIAETEYQLFRVEGHDELMVLDPCWKCGGTGILPAFYHVHDGVCFACRGHRGTYRTPAKQEALIRRRAADARRRAAKADAKAAKVRAEIDAFAAEYTDLAFMATEVVFDDEVGMHHILRDMGAKLHRFGSLSEKQIAFARRIIAEQQEKQARREEEAKNAVPAPTGRQAIEGKIIKAVETESHHGYRTTYNTRITVKTADGWVANGNCPSALFLMVREVADPACEQTPEGYLVGAMVRFTATLETKEEGATFAFFKRPIKPELVEGV